VWNDEKCQASQSSGLGSLVCYVFLPRLFGTIDEVLKQRKGNESIENERKWKGSTLREITTSSIPNSPSLHSNCRDLSSNLSINIITAFGFVNKLLQKHFCPRHFFFGHKRKKKISIVTTSVNCFYIQHFTHNMVAWLRSLPDFTCLAHNMTTVCKKKKKLYKITHSFKVY
jgi:hypothetical protein